MTVTFTVTNPASLDLSNGIILRFAQDAQRTAAVEEYSLEVLLDLWHAGGPYTIEQASQDPWLAAAFFRLCRAKLISLDEVSRNGTINANYREQSAVASDTLP